MQIKKKIVGAHLPVRAAPTQSIPPVVEEKPESLKKKHAGGRPLLFKNAAELENRIDQYFKDCDNRTRKVQEIVRGKVIEIEVANPRPYTLSGLAVALDCDRQTLANYSERDEFFGTVARAKEKCHNYAEESLWIPKISSGVTFVLKNGYGWQDKSEVDHTTQGKSINIYLPKRADK